MTYYDDCGVEIVKGSMIHYIIDKIEFNGNVNEMYDVNNSADTLVAYTRNSTVLTVDFISKNADVIKVIKT